MAEVQPAPESAEEMFDRATALAERHLMAALEEAGDIGGFVAVAMIEASVNAAVEAAGRMDIAAVLRDLAEQIEDDSEDSDEDE